MMCNYCQFNLDRKKLQRAEKYIDEICSCMKQASYELESLLQTKQCKKPFLKTVT